MNAAQMMIAVYDMREKIVGKGENAGWLKAFSPCPTMFSKRFFHKAVKRHDCVVKGSSKALCGEGSPLYQSYGFSISNSKPLQITNKM